MRFKITQRNAPKRAGQRTRERALGEGDGTQYTRSGWSIGDYNPSITFAFSATNGSEFKLICDLDGTQYMMEQMQKAIHAYHLALAAGRLHEGMRHIPVTPGLTFMAGPNEWTVISRASGRSVRYLCRDQNGREGFYSPQMIRRLIELNKR